MITPPTPFSYIFTDPANGYAVAEITNDITVVFNYEVDQASVNSNTFFLRGRTMGLHSGSYSWLDATTLVFTASNAFAYHDQLSLTLTDGITNPEGRPFTPCSFQFRTKAAFACGDFSLYSRVSRLPTSTGQPFELRPGDLDGDGDLDAFVNGSAKAHTYINDGEGNFAVGWQGPHVSSAQGVGLGDLDGDGDLDVFKGGAPVYGVPTEIYLNDGSANFTNTGQVITTAVNRVRLADIDNDGDLDAVTVSSFPYEMYVYKNDGNGFFTEAAKFEVIHISDHRLADMDNDGNIDLVVRSTQLGLTIHDNDGTGDFTKSVRVIQSSSNPYIEAADIDSDGDLDLIMLGSSSSFNRTLINDGNANFTPVQYLGSVGSGAQDIKSGDFDGDGDVDLFISQGKLLINNGSGIFSELALGLPAVYGATHSLCDVDDDGDLDVFGVSSTTPDGGIVYYNQGCVDICVDADINPVTPTPGDLLSYTITLTNQSEFTAKDIVLTNIHPTGSAFVSVNPEGSPGVDRTAITFSELAPGQSTDIVVQVALDLLATGSIVNVSALGVAGDTNLANQLVSLTNTLPATTTFRGIASTPGMHENNVANDATISLTLSETVDPATLSNGTVIVRGRLNGLYTGTIGNPDGTTITFTPNDDFLPGERIVVTLTDGIRSLAGDKKLRLCSIEFNIGSIGCGEFQFVDNGTDVQFTYHYQAVLGDMDQDGDLDAVVSRPSTVDIYWNEGDGNMTNDPTSYAAASIQTVTLGDLNNDGSLDIYAAGSSFNKIYYNNGSGVFTNTFTFSDSLKTYQVVLGDIDGDGDLDAVEFNAAFSGPTLLSTVLFNDGQGNFSTGPQTLLRSGSNIFTGDLRDLDNDGDLDLIYIDLFNRLVTYLNTGTGYFILQPDPEPSASLAGLADFNHDGNLDALISTNFYTVFATNNGLAELSRQNVTNNFPAFTQPGWTEFGDFNGDNLLDGYTVFGSFVTNRVWTNNMSSGYLFSNQPQQSNYNQRTVSLGDIDGDGDLDAILAGTARFIVLRHDNCTYGPVDTDGDGMPDSWELIYFGGNSGIATNNNDGDAFDNLSEYIADTNPTNSMSQFELIAFDIDINGEVTFDSSSERIYTVQCATNLLMPDWENVIVDEPGNGGLITLNVTNGLPDAYYRVVVELP